MQIIEANTILLTHFIKNDSINNEQFSSISPKKTNPLEAEAAFVHSLLEMEAKGIVSKYITTNSDNKTIFVWVLKKPLISLPQSIVIDGNTAMTISNIVNDFYRQMGNKNSISNPINITQEDIAIIIEVIEILAEQNVKNNLVEQNDKK